jgi:hypothetical protein
MIFYFYALVLAVPLNFALPFSFPLARTLGCGGGWATTPTHVLPRPSESDPTPKQPTKSHPTRVLSFYRSLRRIRYSPLFFDMY